jgi:hypothetical protein
MVAPAFEILPSTPEEGADPGPDSDPQILVLDPTGESGSKSILLDQPKQLIGWDVECSIQLPDSGVHARHAVILRGQRQVVVKAWDPRTWLNGHAVTESPLSPGDLLKVGPVEFRVRTATPDELLRELPANSQTMEQERRSESVEWLAWRRSRLAAIRIRLKDRRAELDREFQRLHCEREQFESERLQFQSDCKNAVAATHLPVVGNKADGTTEVTESVADYMQQLLGRMRAERPGDYRPSDSGALGTWPGSGDERASQPARSEPDSESTEDSRRTRRVHNIDEVRAGVGTLREIANFSARSAVAKHSSRKLRRSMTITLPLAVIAFVLAGGVMLLGEDRSRYVGEAFGTLMLGVIVAIEIAHSFWKIRRLERVHTLPANEPRSDARPEAGLNEGADSPPSPECSPDPGA